MTALAGEPVPVEFSHGGTRYSAVLLGWRHHDDGSCDVRVRFVDGGLRRTAWLPLADVALVEPVAPAPRPSPLRPDRDWSRPLVAVPPLRRPPDR